MLLWYISAEIKSKEFLMKSNVILGVNDLQSVFPKLAEEWHPTKNGDLLPSQVAMKTTMKAWWQCKLGHEWKAIISNRSNGVGCPYCTSKAALPGFNDLASQNPELAAEWHPTKNGDLTPDKVTVRSNQVVWWLGACGHEWRTSANGRYRGSGCPFCANKAAWPGFNDLASRNPEIAAEWHPTKNRSLTPERVTAGSAKRVWWKCAEGHEWEAAVTYRTRGYGCPICAKAKKKMRA
jgi:hypothetical protein